MEEPKTDERKSRLLETNIKKLRIRKRILTNAIFLFVLIFSTPLFGEEQKIRFDLLSIKDGLSQSSINAVVQDKQGFIWIGTQDGLNKYDGYSFTTYYHDPEDSTSICDNFIRALEIDSVGNLWIGTDNGLSKFDARSETFTSYYHVSGDKSSPIGDAVRGMDFDKNGMLWVGTANSGLYSFNTKTERAIQYHAGGNGSLSSDNILSLFVDNNNNIWIGTDGSGICQFNRESLNFIRVIGAGYSIGNVIHTFFQDVNNNLWIGTNEGLLLAKNTELSKNKLTVEDVALGNEAISINAIFQAHGDNIWVGTAGGGLFKIKTSAATKHFQIEHFEYNSLVPTSLRDNIVLCLYEDRMGLVWIGTNSGLNKFDPKKQSFRHIMSVEGSTYNLSDNTIWAIYEDTKFLWVGSLKGLDQINLTTGETQSYPNISSSIHYRNNSSVLCINKTSSGDILIGTVDGLYKIEMNLEKTSVKAITPINYNDYYFKKYETNNVYIIHQSSDGRIWVGTKKGLAILSSELKPLGFYTKVPNNENSLPNNTVRFILQDTEEQIWIGSEAGVSKIIEAEGTLRFETYSHSKDQGSLSNDVVMSGWESKDGTLWFGTYGGGLNKFDSQTGTFKVYKEKEGLSNNVVYSILGDNQDRLWMTTNKGLSVFDPKTETFVVYHENDGIQSDEFDNGAYFKNSQGEMYFGGINGISVFNPSEIDKNQYPPQMAFTNFKINNQQVEIGSKEFYPVHLNLIYKMEMSHKIRNFTFEFAALHYSFSKKNQYSYKMVGLDEDWNEVGNQRSVHYTNLPPGEYTLIVKGTNSDGVESDNVATLKLIITPPFWLTWWFWIVSFVSVVGAIILGIRIRINQIKSQKEALELLVKTRTTEVTFQKEKIEEQKNELEIAKEKSEKLLLNILPEEMVDELKVQGKAKARSYKRVTVMFTDFKGFTQISESLKPTELVERLDSYFIKFDEIIEKYNVEKIKTIGDAYMCAGGVPIRNKSNPIEVVLAGLDIQNYIYELKEKDPNNKDLWELRIGIHSGELIAGVIGIKRFAYDIWGDTVNIAQRMEMTGEVGKVNISGETYELVKMFFECTHRGKVQAKNKGEIDMYFVEGIKLEMSKDGKGRVPNDLFWDYVDLELYSSINYKHAEKFIVKTLKAGLSEDLTYHNIGHMTDVCASAERIAKEEGIKGEELFLLKTAALYHDGGFVEQYQNNESIGARMAKDALPVYGYSDEELNTIERLILATSIPQQPKDLLEEIICDADLDYLGRDDFYKISNQLMHEFVAYGVVKDAKTWDELQIEFISAHKYFTKTSIETREANKQLRLREIKERYKKDEY